MRAGQIHGDHVGALADLQRPTLSAMPRGPRAAERATSSIVWESRKRPGVHGALQHAKRISESMSVDSVVAGESVPRPTRRPARMATRQAALRPYPAGRGPGHTDSDVVGAQLLQILVVHVDRADDHDVVGAEGVPVEGVAHRLTLGGQPGRDLYVTALPIAAVRGRATSQRMKSDSSRLPASHRATGRSSLRANFEMAGAWPDG